tara:strand:+ start:3365 stop:4198 length:834 start_codon:yes stop_codon:yes gene_type:complete
MATIDVIANRSTATEALGKAYFETDTNSFIVYNGSGWVELQSDGVGSAAPFSQYSLEFDSVDDGLQAGSSFTLSGSSAWTVSFWAKGLSTSGNKDTWNIMNSESAGYTGNGYFQFGTRAVNQDGFVLAVDSGGYIYGAYSSSIFHNQWNHIAYTHNGSGTRTLYVNGVQRGQRTGVTGDTFTAGTWLYGKPGISQSLSVALDEIALVPSDESGDLSVFWDTAPTTTTQGTAADISSLNPTNWWRMEDSSGSTVTDYGSAGNDATIQNQSTFSSDTPS